MALNQIYYLGKNNEFKIQTAPDGDAAYIVQIGTSAAYLDSSSTSFKGLEFRLSSSATSGDVRGMYLRFQLNGTGTTSGEALRVYTNVNDNIATAHGAHIGLSFYAEAGGSECSGLAAAVRGTLQIPDIASWAPTGTYCAGMFEIYSDGDDSDPAGMTELSVLRLCNSGDATGKGDVDDDAFLFSVQGFDDTKASGHLLQSDGDEPTWDNVTTYIKVKLGSETMYLLAVPAYASD